MGNDTKKLWKNDIIQKSNGVVGADGRINTVDIIWYVLYYASSMEEESISSKQYF